MRSNWRRLRGLPIFKCFFTGSISKKACTGHGVYPWWRVIIVIINLAISNRFNSLMYGSGNADKEITSNLTAQTGLVTVTLNYRLNVFGFLALSELTKESPWATSGNYGFYDQIMALKVSIEELDKPIY